MNFKRIIKIILFVCLIFFVLNFSNNTVYLSSENDFSGMGSGGGNGLNGAITLIIVLMGGAISLVYQLHKISKISPKLSLPKPKIDDVQPATSKFIDPNDESAPQLLRLMDKLERDRLNLLKPPEIPIMTPFEKALGDFYGHLVIFTAFFFILYLFYSRDAFGFKTFVEVNKSKINKKHIIWRYRFYIILTFQFIVTMLILFL